MSADAPGVKIGTWYRHRHSQNTFQVTKIHAAHVETRDADGVSGFANLYLLEAHLRTGNYETFEAEPPTL